MGADQGSHLGFLFGWGGIQPKTFVGVGRDPAWNCTLHWRHPTYKLRQDPTQNCRWDLQDSTRTFGRDTMREVPKSCSGSYLGLAGSGLLPLLGAQRTKKFFRQFAVYCICRIDVHFSRLWLYEHTNIMAFLLLVLLKASGLIMNWILKWRLRPNWMYVLKIRKYHLGNLLALIIH